MNKGYFEDFATDESLSKAYKRLCHAVVIRAIQDDFKKFKSQYARDKYSNEYRTVKENLIQSLSENLNMDDSIIDKYGFKKNIKRFSLRDWCEKGDIDPEWIIDKINKNSIDTKQLYNYSE